MCFCLARVIVIGARDYFNSFCIDSFLNILKSLMEFHQTLQTHSHLQDKY